MPWNRRWLVVAGSLAWLLIWSLMPALAQPCTHYAHPTGSGSACTLGSPCQIRTFILNHASAGNTLCLNDGEYLGYDNMLDIPDGAGGASGNPVTIRAINDGGAYINGQYNFYTFYLGNGTHDWTFEGFDVGQGVREVINLDWFGIATRPNRITLRRVCGFNANVGPNPTGSSVMNVHNFSNGANNALLEDICLFGWGRNSYTDTYAEHLTIRRMWAKWEGGYDDETVGWDGGPAYQLDYSTDKTVGHDALYQNMVSIYSTEKIPFLQGLSGSAMWFSRSGLQRFNNGNYANQSGNLFAGHIGYAYPNSNQPVGNYLGQRWAPNRHVDLFIDARAMAATHPNGNVVSIGCDLYNCECRSTGQICSLCNESGSCSNVSTDRITVAKGVASQSIDMPGNASNVRTCFNPGSGGDCPNVYTGEGGPGSGSRLCYEYTNGALDTNSPLWPWRMDDRIKFAMANRGFSNALAGGGSAGVYAANTFTSEMVNRYGTIPGACLRGEAPPVDPPTVGTFHLAPTTATPPGNDANTCTAATNGATPKATFASVFACMAGGSTLKLASGTYVQRIDASTMPVRGGADWNAPTVITPETAGDTVILKPTGAAPVGRMTQAENHYVIIDRLILDAADATDRPVSITNSAGHIRLQNVVLRNSTASLFLIDSTSDNEIEDSTLQGGLYSLLIQGANPSRNKIIHNDISGFSAGGIYDEFGTDTRIERNIVHGQTGTDDAGITIDGASNDKVINNIVWSTSLGIRVRANAANTELYHNTVTENTGKGIEIVAAGGTPSGTIMRNTIIWNNGAASTTCCGTSESHTLLTDPLFENAAGHIYRLTKDSAGAKNQGQTLGTVTIDQKGVGRPSGSASDIGADEFVEGTASLDSDAVPRHYLTGFMIPR